MYRLVTQGTVEEQILTLHTNKRTMVAGLLDSTGSATALTTDELMALLSDEGLETEPAALETEAPPVARAIVSSALAQPETPAPVPVDVEPKEPTFTDERIVSPAVPAPVTTTPPRITPLALVLRALQQSKTALKRADIIAATNVDEALWPGLKVALESDDNVELSGQARGRAYRWIGPVSAGS